MERLYSGKAIISAVGVAWLYLLLAVSISHGEDKEKGPQGPPPVPVKVAPVIQETVSEQIGLVGTTEPIARSKVAAEISGLVEEYPVREGDFVEKGQVLVRLRSKDLTLRLKAAEALREKVRANLLFAEKELARYGKLKDADSIAARKYDEALYQDQSLKQELLRTEAEIDLLKDDIRKMTVVAPFSGYVALEHTQIGEWLPMGGPREVVTLLDMGHMRITVDVPERYAVNLLPQSPVRVLVASLSNEPFAGKISAILPEGDANARTFPVRVILANPGLKIKSGMEAKATFSLGTTKDALLVPKDAIVTAGANRLVYVIASTVAQPVTVQVMGYHDGNVAVEGPLKVGDSVVIRGNERLRPGQVVEVIK
ncbi:MAG: efflux RND transporter periplasmic adaptor subunit [Thermodesulfobacteriota bacterium]|nr:efflux RND transporter periplasmic adaptor subunit [Thermodesulfobacteriota bacterium]